MRRGRILPLALGVVLGMSPALSWAGEGEDAPAQEPAPSKPQEPAQEPAPSEPQEPDGDKDGHKLHERLEEAKGIPAFEKLRTPHSPAFVVLGVAPVEIQRPSTPLDFGLALTADWGDDLALPRSMAIEVAPYWWFPHRRLTFDDYLEAGWWSNLLRNTTLSVATTSSGGIGAGADSPAQTWLAAGVQTQVFQSKSRADICAGDVQAKAITLATLLVRGAASESADATRALILAAAERAAWRDMAGPLEAREDADEAQKRAEAVLADEGASAARKAEAEKALARAVEKHAGATAELEELEQRSAQRVAIIEERHADATQAVARARKPAERELAARALEDASAARRVAAREAEVIRMWRTTAAAQAQKNAAAAAAREAALDKARVDAADKQRAVALEAAESKLEELVGLCKDASVSRVGFSLSLAAAVSILFPDATFAGRELDAWATWYTLAHTWKQGTTVASMLRLTSRRLDGGQREVALDVGGRLIQAKNRYAASAEVIKRFLSDETSGVRAAVAGEYMVRKGTWLSVSFGKDFSQDGAIFSLANLNWGIGGEASPQ